MDHFKNDPRTNTIYPRENTIGPGSPYKKIPIRVNVNEKSLRALSYINYIKNNVFHTVCQS